MQSSKTISQSKVPVENSDLCTEEEINQLVRTFYAKARKDALLGPIFEAHVMDWEAHFIQMTDFWSGNLLGTSRFRGTPMPKHLAIPGLHSEFFERWLQIFKETLRDLPNSALEINANIFAYRIACRLWMGYQMQNYPNEPLIALREA
ncbi:preprotein translocase subunit TatC [Nitrosomonadaceae bacterium]|nr:group III truncated hemoglobin [Nitrosospira sp.]MBI0417189.1 group III truncated hemoglobin [Nitrosospira sp.]MBI0419384.1 group III truncated hemoglobin [Nitrosospira sp.]MDW7642499.1 group III truncated hemoglobin [Nitrosomonadaceae bacterium]GDX61076.1 preprotein translocase subunit TatC [Nitrosomonadaceae bacterium]